MLEEECIIIDIIIHLRRHSDLPQLIMETILLAKKSNLSIMFGSYLSHDFDTADMIGRTGYFIGWVAFQDIPFGLLHMGIENGGVNFRMLSHTGTTYFTA